MTKDIARVYLLVGATVAGMIGCRPESEPQSAGSQGPTYESDLGKPPVRNEASAEEALAQKAAAEIREHVLKDLSEIGPFLEEVTCRAIVDREGTNRSCSLVCTLKFGSVFEAFEASTKAGKVLKALGYVKFVTMNLLDGIASAREEHLDISHVRIEMRSAHGSVEHLLGPKQFARLKNAGDEEAYMVLYKGLGREIGPNPSVVDKATADMEWILELLREAAGPALLEKPQGGRPPTNR